MPAGRLLTTAAALIAIVTSVLAATLATAQHEHDGATPGAHEGHTMTTPGDDPGGTGTGVVYMTITNTGDEDDALLGAGTDRAQIVEVHEMRVQNDVGVMLPHEGPVVIPAGEAVSLEPGGLHMMLIDLNDDILLGDTFDLTLEFERAGTVTVPVTAVLDAEEAEGEPVQAGDLEITGVWSRPAPRIDGVPATAAASPDA